MKRTQPTLRKSGAAPWPLSHELMTVSPLATAAGEPVHAVPLLLPDWTIAFLTYTQQRLPTARSRRIDPTSIHSSRAGPGLHAGRDYRLHARRSRGERAVSGGIGNAGPRLSQIGEKLSNLVELHARKTRGLHRWRTLGEGVPTGYVICRLIESEELAPDESGSAPASQPEFATESSS